MPMDRGAALQLGLLLMAVPTQFLISQYFTTPELQRHHTLQKLVSGAVGLKDKYLDWQYWQRLCASLLSGVPGYSSRYGTASDDPAENDLGESPAIEVMKYNDPDGYFAGSTQPRTPRAPHVKYRVGQVIKHKRWGYRGIIVGWDERARAPAWWLKEMHGDNKYWRDMPNYSVLVDTRDRLTPQKTYVVEENMLVISNTPVIHPEIDRYFENYDGAQYLPRPWLRTIYPHD